MSERLEEIEERTRKLEASPRLRIFAGHVAKDYAYLIERVRELEKQNQKLRDSIQEMHVNNGGFS